jgi:hypothetical protein
MRSAFSSVQFTQYSIEKGIQKQSNGRRTKKAFQFMKKHNSIIQILSLTCAYLVVTGCATQPGAATSALPNSGHLLVYRAAKFGYRLNLVLSVDGKDVASLTEGQNYDGYLPAGQHVLGARVTGGTTGAHVVQKTVTVQAGQTYSYTATLSGGHLALIKK